MHGMRIINKYINKCRYLPVTKTGCESIHLFRTMSACFRAISKVQNVQNFTSMSTGYIRGVVLCERGNFTLNTVNVSLNLSQLTCKQQQVSDKLMMVKTNILMLVHVWCILTTYKGATQ
jgi:hypothetical protein